MVKCNDDPSCLFTCPHWEQPVSCVPQEWQPGQGSTDKTVGKFSLWIPTISEDYLSVEVGCLLGAPNSLLHLGLPCQETYPKPSGVQQSGQALKKNDYSRKCPINSLSHHHQKNLPGLLGLCRQSWGKRRFCFTLETTIYEEFPIWPRARGLTIAYVFPLLGQM